MKTLFKILIIFLPLFSQGQAHLGYSLSELKAIHPDKEFGVGNTDDGISYTYTSMPLGVFCYYFSNETNVSKLCIQIPDDLRSLNSQIEIYNNKYVIESNTSWKAYLEGGGVMKIILSYDEENETYIFIYTNWSEFSQEPTTKANYVYTKL